MKRGGCERTWPVAAGICEGIARRRKPVLCRFPEGAFLLAAGLPPTRLPRRNARLTVSFSTAAVGSDPFIIMLTVYICHWLNTVQEFYLVEQY